MKILVERLSRFAEEHVVAHAAPISRRTNWSDLAALGKLGWEDSSKMPDEERMGRYSIFTQSVAEFLEPLVRIGRIESYSCDGWSDRHEWGPSFAGHGIRIAASRDGKSGWTSRALGICARRHGRNFTIDCVSGARRRYGDSCECASIENSGQRRCSRVRGQSEWYSITAKKFTRAR